VGVAPALAPGSRSCADRAANAISRVVARVDAAPSLAAVGDGSRGTEGASTAHRVAAMRKVACIVVTPRLAVTTGGKNGTDGTATAVCLVASPLVAPALAKPGCRRR